jgi:hypothetical protein
MEFFKKSRVEADAWYHASVFGNFIKQMKRIKKINIISVHDNDCM